MSARIPQVLPSTTCAHTIVQVDLVNRRTIVSLDARKAYIALLNRQENAITMKRDVSRAMIDRLKDTLGDDSAWFLEEEEKALAEIAKMEAAHKDAIPKYLRTLLHATTPSNVSSAVTDNVDLGFEGHEQIQFLDGHGVPQQEKLVACCFVPGQVAQYAQLFKCNLFCIDGTHMKDGQTEKGTKGQIISCYTLDGFNMILPLGFCYCFAESHATLEILVQTLTKAGFDLNRDDVVIMSDRSLAAFALMARTLPRARHRWCEQHLIRNINKANGNKLDGEDVSAIRDAFRALTRRGFDASMKKLEHQCPFAYRYLAQLDVNCWASYTFAQEGVPTWGIATNNAAEQGGWSLMGGRHVKTLYEAIYVMRSKVNEAIVRRQHILIGLPDDANVLSYASECVDREDKEALHLDVKRVDWSADLAARGSGSPGTSFSGKFVVTDSNQLVHSCFHVDLDDRVCTCGRWQDLGYPCRHLLAIVRLLNIDQGVFLVAAYAPMFWAIYIRDYFTQPAFSLPTSHTVSSGSLMVVQPGQNSAGVALNRGRGRPSKEKRIRSIGE